MKRIILIAVLFITLICARDVSAHVIVFNSGNTLNVEWVRITPGYVTYPCGITNCTISSRIVKDVLYEPFFVPERSMVLEEEEEGTEIFIRDGKKYWK